MTVENSSVDAEGKATETTTDVAVDEKNKSTADADDTKKTEDQTTKKETDPAAEVSSLQEQLSKLQKDLEKLTKKNSELEESRDKAKENLRTFKMDQALTGSLAEAGVVSSATALKLIDKSLIKFDDNGAIVSATVAAAVEALKTSDPILFKSVEQSTTETSVVSTSTEKKNPPVKRAGEGNDEVTSYQRELRAAKTTKELNAVLKKYGKI